MSFTIVTLTSDPFGINITRTTSATPLNQASSNEYPRAKGPALDGVLTVEELKNGTLQTKAIRKGSLPKDYLKPTYKLCFVETSPENTVEKIKEFHAHFSVDQNLKSKSKGERIAAKKAQTARRIEINPYTIVTLTQNADGSGISINRTTGNQASFKEKNPYPRARGPANEGLVTIEHLNPDGTTYTTRIRRDVIPHDYLQTTNKMRFIEVSKKDTNKKKKIFKNFCKM